MSKRKLTTKQQALRDEYKKERNRIRRFVKRRTKQGFLIDESIIPQTVTQKGKITSRDIQRLKNITPEKIYSKSEFLDYETGEVVNAKSGKILARKRQYINGEMIETYVEPLSYTTYEQIREILSNITHKNDYGEPIPSETYEEVSNALVRVLDNEMDEYGQEYEEFLHFNSSEIKSLVRPVEYASTQEQLREGVTQLARALTMVGHLSPEIANEVAEMTHFYDIEGALML